MAPKSQLNSVQQMLTLYLKNLKNFVALTDLQLQQEMVHDN